MRISDKTIMALVVVLATVMVLQTVVFVLVVGTASPVPTGRATASSAQGSVGFTFVRTGICAVPLTQGWTLISLCANATDTSIATLLSGINYRYVMRWNVSNQSFDIFSPRAASPPFTTLEYNTSYFINLNSASASMQIPGVNVSDINVSLGSGWNGPGFPYNLTTNITLYFNTTTHRYLMKWNASAQEFIVYSPRAELPAFTLISGGEGQMLNAYQDDILRYNRTFLES